MAQQQQAPVLALSIYIASNAHPVQCTLQPSPSKVPLQGGSCPTIWSRQPQTGTAPLCSVPAWLGEDSGPAHTRASLPTLPRASPTHQQHCSRCSSVTAGGYTAHNLENPVLVTKEGLYFWAPQDTFCIRPLTPRIGNVNDLPNTETKWGNWGICSKQKTKPQKKAIQNRDKQSTW